jgi:hypothetical protein
VIVSVVVPQVVITSALSMPVGLPDESHITTFFSVILASEHLLLYEKVTFVIMAFVGIVKPKFFA